MRRPTRRPNWPSVREARGEFLLFLDADTLLPADTLRAGVNALRDGAVGCGVRLQFDQKPGFVMRCVVWGIESTLRACRYAPGCCVFVRRDVFERVGGFPEEFYASEEIWLSRALKREGSFRMLQESVVTSAKNELPQHRSHSVDDGACPAAWPRRRDIARRA